MQVTTRIFLDRPEVFRRISRNRRLILARLGRYSQTVMRRLQRKVGPDGPASQPGEPPHARVGTIRSLTTFGVADAGQTVVTGPLPIQRARASIVHGKAGVPQLLNEGGRETFLGGRGGRADFVSRYEPRPFTEPTMRRVWPWAKGLLRRQTLTR